jgi:hypothetical protein
MAKPSFLLVLVLALVLAALALPAQADPLPDLRAEFWTDLDGIPRADEIWPLSDADASRRLLSEAAYVFGGMIGGFEFEWTPAERARGIAERFALKPLFAVADGDPRMLPGEARKTYERMSAWIEWKPDATDRLDLEASRGARWKSSQGRGVADRMRGYAGRREAYEAAIKAGIEALERTVEPNRPRLVRGRAVFAAVPLLGIVDGAYTVQARLRIEVTEVLRYSLF